ncbi:MAG: signal recognition particle-docking protein FtsY, partial [Frankiales bacterium]|nr:signal recognition particle-docking protein FtsY [Frankiales bacterium]
MLELIGLLVAVLVVTVVAVFALVSRRGRSKAPAPRPGIDYRPGTGDDAEIPRDTPLRSVDVVDLPLLPDVETVGAVLDVPDPTAGRLTRLRARLARSQTTLGRGLFALL